VDGNHHYSGPGFVSGATGICVGFGDGGVTYFTDSTGGEWGCMGRMVTRLFWTIGSNRYNDDGKSTEKIAYRRVFKVV